MALALEIGSTKCSSNLVMDVVGQEKDCWILKNSTLSLHDSSEDKVVGIMEDTWETIGGTISLDKLPLDLLAYRERFPGYSWFPTESGKTSRGVEGWDLTKPIGEQGSRMDSKDILHLFKEALTIYESSGEKYQVKGASGLEKIIRGALLRQGIHLTPWKDFVTKFINDRDRFKTKAKARNALKEKLAILCGRHTKKVILEDGEEVPIRHRNTFFSKEHAAKDMVNHPKKCTTIWAAVTVDENELIGFVDALKTEEWATSVATVTENPEADFLKEPWRNTNRVWHYNLLSDPSKDKTPLYVSPGQSLYIDVLCAGRGDKKDYPYKNVGKYLLVWAWIKNLSKSYYGTLLEVGFTGPVETEGISADVPCLHMPSMDLAALYHEVFKYQRVFSLTPEARQFNLDLIEACVKRIYKKLLKNDVHRRAPDSIKAQIVSATIRTYQAIYLGKMGVFVKENPSPYALYFDKPTLSKEKREDAELYGKMVNVEVLKERAHKIKDNEHLKGRLLAIDRSKDLNKQPYRYLTTELYRPFPTESQIRSILGSIMAYSWSTTVSK